MLSKSALAVDAWILTLQGGIVEGARIVCCSPGFLSKLRTGKKKPGRKLSTRIRIAVPRATIIGWDQYPPSKAA